MKSNQNLLGACVTTTTDATADTTYPSEALIEVAERFMKEAKQIDFT